MGKKNLSFRITELYHNGVLVPRYEPVGFTIRYRGRPIKLSPEQEEMAVAWVKKLGTDYVQDPVFVKNFFRDFAKALGLGSPASPNDFDFSEIQRWLEQEKKKKETMTKEEKKRLSEQRKKQREENKERYGYAIINGQRVEIANYTVEPPCIFIGRGKHPLRGRWKPRVTYSDIVLNLSPDAPTPPTPTGEKWGGRVFDPSALWIAKWRDKLTGKLKYVWISESSEFRQLREKEKYETARRLDGYIQKVRAHIWENLDSPDELRRKIATVAYLIDALKLRVGDEKDKDEADTVGATTLRGSHVRINSDGTVKFDFLGKDSVRWVKTVKLPDKIIRNLKSFIKGPRDRIFDGVRSELVNEFLSEAMPGLTAKVFRTYHATKIVEEFLDRHPVSPDEHPIVKKFVAVQANLNAAIECNHKRKLPKNWRESIKKKAERVKKLQEALKLLNRKFETDMKKQKAKFAELLKRRESRVQAIENRLAELRQLKPTPARKKLIRKLRVRLRQEKKRIREIKKDFRERMRRRKEKYEQRVKRYRERILIAKVKYEIAKRTRNYNLNTSLKSYIDPRAFFYWAKKLNYDWREIYPKALQRKFEWVETKTGR
jgi:DNA topoisomerase-1